MYLSKVARTLHKGADDRIAIVGAATHGDDGRRETANRPSDQILPWKRRRNRLRTGGDRARRERRQRDPRPVTRDDWYFGSLMTWHVIASDSGDQLTVGEALVRAGSEPPLHVHAREDEAFFVLEGHVLFQRGLERIAAGPGQAVLLPRGIPHGFAVQSATARMLFVFTPAGLEEAFRSVSVPAEARVLPPEADRPSDPSVLATAERAFGACGVTFVGPPLPVLLASEDRRYTDS